MGEQFDILDEHGQKTGQVKDRNLVHQDGAHHLALNPQVRRLNATAPIGPLPCTVAYAIAEEKLIVEKVQATHTTRAACV